MFKVRSRIGWCHFSNNGTEINPKTRIIGARLERSRFGPMFEVASKYPSIKAMGTSRM
jgi:hypothetical protein